MTVSTDAGPSVARGHGRLDLDPALAAVAAVLAALALALAVSLAFDGRTIEGEPALLKPLKFAISLALYAGTLALYARWLPAGFRASRAVRIYTLAVVAAIVLEMVWVTAAATLGTRSHFNEAPVWTEIYGLMGVLAVLLTSASLVFGIALWRGRNPALPGVVRLSLGVALVLTFVLTLVTAGTLAATGPHPAGAPPPQAGSIAFLGWSLVAGDLRIAHFLATHALHAIPLAGLLALPLGGRAGGCLVWLAAAVYVALVVAAYAAALAGISPAGLLW